MRLTRLCIVSVLGLSILACGGDLEVELDAPLVADDDEEGEEEGEEEEEDEGAEDTDDEGEDEEADGPVEVDLSSAEAAATTFAKGVSAGDSEAISAARADSCDPCDELADEAGKEGMTVTVGGAKEKGDRAVARVEACEGDDCDTLVVYLEKSGGDWKVAWLDEDEDHGRGYLRGKAPAKR